MYIPTDPKYKTVVQMWSSSTTELSTRRITVEADLFPNKVSICSTDSHNQMDFFQPAELIFPKESIGKIHVFA